MSQHFNLGDETLWNPSNGATRLFLGQLAVFEAELGLPGGIGPMENDECQVEPVAFAVFASALLAWHRRARHAVVLVLSEGFVATVLALAEGAAVDLERAEPGVAAQGERDVQVPVPPDLVDHGRARRQLRERVREISRAMPR
ncbi:DUF6086 family protein [Streptomyces sp. NPDC088733]|uniref:DUF6086 family protein n=1 Tax=Streptomyces sp. NPDC088733 TaxID=3365880 RepID=UPI00380C259C